GIRDFHVTGVQTCALPIFQARNQASQANTAVAGNAENVSAVKGLIGAETALTGAMGRFFALAEAYPDLKSQGNMGQLMEELASRSEERRVGKECRARWSRE